MTVLETRSGKTFAGPGIWAYDAEAKVDNDGEIVYVHFHYHCGEYLTVAEESIFDFMTQKAEDPYVDFIEEYDDLDGAQESEYYDVFVKLDEIINEIM